MIVCTFIDLEFRILPDEITLSGVAIGLAVSAAFPFLSRRDRDGLRPGRQSSAAFPGTTPGTGFRW